MGGSLDESEFDGEIARSTGPGKAHKCPLAKIMTNRLFIRDNAAVVQ